MKDSIPLAYDQDHKGRHFYADSAVRRFTPSAFPAQVDAELVL